MVFRSSGPSPSRPALRSRWALPRTLFSLPAVSLLAFSACGEPVNEPQTTLVSAAVSAKKAKPDGEELFDTAFAGTNGRSCATCHVRE